MANPAAGSGGLSIPVLMRDLARRSRPGQPLRGSPATKLRNLYAKHSEPFNPTLLSPFGLACFTGNLQEVKQRGVPEAASETPFEWGWVTLAVLGAQRISRAPIVPDHAGVIEYLVTQQTKAVDINLPDIAGYTALHHACISAPQPKLIELLIQKGANVDAQDKFGCTPLLCAMCGRQTMSVHGPGLDACEMLLSYGANPDIPDGDGTTFMGFPKQLVESVTRRALALANQRQAGKAAKAVASPSVPAGDIGAARESGEAVVIAGVGECPRECVVKIQVPFHGDGGLLLYDQRRQFTLVWTKDREPDVYFKLIDVIKAGPNGGYKSYFKVERVGKDSMRIYLDPVEQPEW